PYPFFVCGTRFTLRPFSRLACRSLSFPVRINYYGKTKKTLARGSCNIVRGRGLSTQSHMVARLARCNDAELLSAAVFDRDFGTGSDCLWHRSVVRCI